MQTTIRHSFKQNKRSYVVAIVVIVILGMIMTSTTLLSDPLNQEYKYQVLLGSPEEYRLIYGYDSHLYRNEKNTIKTVLSFPALGEFFGNNWWGSGSDATSIFEKNQLPHSVDLNWFSPFEDQLWVGYADFDQDFFRQLDKYKPTDLVTRNTARLMESFDFIINVAPGGFGAIWISGAGDKYLLSEFQGRKSTLDSWRFFIQVLGYRKDVPTREAFIEELLSRQSEEFQQAYHDKTLDLSGNEWRRMMKRYPWQIVGNEHYRVDEYFARYTNGEQYNYYATGGNPFRDQHAVPYELFLFIEGTDADKRYERVYVLLDKALALNAFEEVYDPNSTYPLALQFSFNKEIDQVWIYLTQEERKAQIPFLKAYLEDI